MSMGEFQIDSKITLKKPKPDARIENTWLIMDGRSDKEGYHDNDKIRFRDDL